MCCSGRGLRPLGGLGAAAGSPAPCPVTMGGHPRPLGSTERSRAGHADMDVDRPRHTAPRSQHGPAPAHHPAARKTPAPVRSRRVGALAVEPSVRDEARQGRARPGRARGCSPCPAAAPWLLEARSGYRAPRRAGPYRMPPVYRQKPQSASAGLVQRTPQPRGHTHTDTTRTHTAQDMHAHGGGTRMAQWGTCLLARVLLLSLYGSSVCRGASHEESGPATCQALPGAHTPRTPRLEGPA